MRKPARPLWACGLALSLVSAQAQQPAPTPMAPELLLPAVESDVVNVDVFVTGKDGRPVRDMRPEDFEVFEDGARVQVVNFMAGLRQPPRPGEAAVSVPGEPAAAARQPLPEERLHLVVYVDNANLSARTRKRVIEPLQRFFTGDRPNQRAMVVTHSESIQVRQPLTDDLAAVRATLKSVEKDRSEQRLYPQKRMIVSSLETAEDDEAGALLFQVRNYAQQASQELRSSLEALRGTIDMMGGLPGRKVLLYVSDGLQERPGAELLQLYANRFGDDAVNDGSVGGLPTGGGRGAGLFAAFADLQQTHLFKEVLAHANANRVTLYAIDASQAEAQFSVSASDRALDSFGEVHPGASSVRTIETHEKSATLAYLAEYTGGRSLSGNLKLNERLAVLAEDLEAGYALAYAPPHGADGRNHKIEVKSARSGVSLRHREGYRSKTAEERSSDLAFSALLGDTDNPLGIALQSGPPKAAEKDTFLVPLIVKLAVGQVQLHREGDADVGKLVVYLVIQDEQGGLSDAQRREVPLRFPAGTIKPGSQQVMGYPVPIKMKAGEYVIGVGLRDELAGRRSGASLKLKVG